jgi:chemotaxis-related protein WspB
VKSVLPFSGSAVEGGAHRYTSGNIIEPSKKLFLLFNLDKYRYALEARRIAEIVPMVAIRRMPAAIHGIAGEMEYGGRFLPVLDLNELTSGKPTSRRPSARIVLMNCPAADGSLRLLGLLAERATRIVRLGHGDFGRSDRKEAKRASLTAFSFGPVNNDPGTPILPLDVNKLLPAAAREFLFDTSATPRQSSAQTR